jgi:hypothetical protein
VVTAHLRQGGVILSGNALLPALHSYHGPSTSLPVP